MYADNDPKMNPIAKNKGLMSKPTKPKIENVNAIVKYI